MTTKEAIQAMLDGKKVRAENWEEGYYVHFSDLAGFLDESLALTYITPEYDWEIYEEPKPKQTVVIEKWLCKGEEGFVVLEVDNSFQISYDYEKVKLLDTYEVEL